MRRKGCLSVEKTIKVCNANENNLKGISVDIPKECICGVCGVSGSGKSTLACNVIAKYALNAFALSMTAKLRRKLSDGKCPNVKEVRNVPPVILIDIKNANRSIRSTVATTSGLMTILRNMFSLCGRTINENNALNKTKIYPRLFSYNMQENEGGGACSCCRGTGKADGILPEDIICNEKKAVFSGAFSVVNDKGIKFTKVTDLFVKAFCKEYAIDIEKPVNEFSKDEMNLILYGSDKLICFTDRSGANDGKKKLAFPGIIGALLEVYNRTKNANIEKCITNGICNFCKGTRYNSSALQYTIDEFSISDFLSMSIRDARMEICRLSDNYGEKFKGFAEEFSQIAEELERIGVGYLSLNRAISTISGGELQRIKLAKQIAMKLEGYCYVIDEPSTGLHDSNIVDLMDSIERLKMNHNTVLLVEHNPLILKACDCLIELGEGGGNQGGNIVAVGTPSEIVEADTLTGKMLNKKLEMDNIENYQICKKIGLYGVSVNNLKNVDIILPLNSFVTVAGVSGSGKSSAINTALYDTVKNYIDTGKKEYNLSIEEKFKNIVRLDQNASVTNSRSNVSTLLGIMDNIRKIFSKSAQCKKLGFDASVFLKNSKVGACPLCGGLGIIEDEDKNEETCEECNGTGYKKEVLQVKYKGYNISELLALSIEKIIEIIEDDEVKKILKTCCNIGLDYLSLDRKSPSLSKGEYQRIRIVTEICKTNSEKSIYILDEPSKGLHFSDVKKIIRTVRELVAAGNTVIAIEHNLDVIMSSDFVIEFGPDAGVDGGNIVFSGVPGELFKANTHTAEAIRGYKAEQFVTKIDKYSDEIAVKSENIEFVIDKNKLNILRGFFGSGKTLMQRNLLYANPLKKYVSSISNQGKYLTRDIVAKKSYGISLPITRFISDDRSIFGKNERVAETLNLTHLVENMFYEYGENNDGLYRGSFNFAKKAGKCKSCSGFGRIISYDFDMVFSDDNYTKELNDLLWDRTRISRISPLLKKEYGIDISKDYAKMSEGERQLFIFGDKNKTVYYEPKKKEYFWEGCNTILSTNMSYASEPIQKFVKPTYAMRVCKYCNGIGVDKKVSETSYKGIKYKEFNEIRILDLSQKLKNQNSTLCFEEQQFTSILDKLIEFGAGNLKLGEYTAELNLKMRMIIQYVSYRTNPLSDTMIVWDDFGFIKDTQAKCKLLEDFGKAISEHTIILVADNELQIDDFNEIILDGSPISSGDMANKNGLTNILFVEDSHGAISKYELEVPIRETIGSSTNCISLIRNEFKKKYKKFKFTGIKDEEKCDKCNGVGYYEINMGDIGYSKCVCPDCNGSGFSESINSCYINEKNFGEVLNMPLKDLHDWSKKSGLLEITNKIELYVKIGLEKVTLSEKMCNLSSKESELYMLANMLEGPEKEVKIVDFFENMLKVEYDAIIVRLNDLAIEKNKKILIVKE